MGLFSMTVHAADNATEPGELVWFGLDYSLVKFIGLNSQFSDLAHIQGHYFRAWNELIIVEQEKYDLKKAFSAQKVTFDLENAISRSQEIDMNQVVQSESYRIGEEQAIEVAMAYTDRSVEKVGALFVMETLDKLGESSSMWLVVFNISTGEILHVNRHAAAPGGFGFRNYWARSYYNVIKGLSININRLIQA